MRNSELIGKPVLCACGCGQTVISPKRNRVVRFVHGHANRVLWKGQTKPWLQEENLKKRKQHTSQDGVEGKTCGVCGEWKPLSSFGSAKNTYDHLENRCRPCNTARVTAYYHKHARKINAARRTAQYRNKMRAWYRRWEQNKRRTDVNYHLRKRLRFSLWSALSGRRKSAPALKLLGCSLDELKAHLEQQFQPGMNWANYGKGGWEIDHIQPCASFDLSDSRQQEICFHYTNLQPLWGIDNWRKGDRI